MLLLPIQIQTVSTTVKREGETLQPPVPHKKVLYVTNVGFRTVGFRLVPVLLIIFVRQVRRPGQGPVGLPDYGFGHGDDHWHWKPSPGTRRPSGAGRVAATAEAGDVIGMRDQFTVQNHLCTVQYIAVPHVNTSYSSTTASSSTRIYYSSTSTSTSTVQYSTVPHHIPCTVTLHTTLRTTYYTMYYTMYNKMHVAYYYASAVQYIIASQPRPRNKP